jgi:hypothetical protein
MEKKNKLFFTIGISVLFISIFSCNQPVEKAENFRNKKPKSEFSPESVTILEDSLVPIELRATHAIKVLLPKAGKLKKGDIELKNGRFVHEGELLVQLSFEEEYNQLVELKKRLSKEVNDFLQFPFIASNENLTKKWGVFEEALSPAKRLPSFPLIDSDDEKRELKLTLIGKYYLQATVLERSIETAFIFAPASGWLDKVSFSIGDNIDEGQVAAEIITNKHWRLKNESVTKQLKGYEWPIVNTTGKKVGKLIRKPKSGDTYSVQFAPGIELMQNAPFFIVSKRTIMAHRIPKMYLKGRTVLGVQNEQERSISIKIIKQSKDSVWVTGLPEKCNVKQF